MTELTFNVYVPSYQRYGDKVRIYDHLEYCTYVVRKSEEASTAPPALSESGVSKTP